MEDIGFFGQGWMWLQSQKLILFTALKAFCIRQKFVSLLNSTWLMTCCLKVSDFVVAVLTIWKECIISGYTSWLQLGPAALLLLLWSCFLSLSSLSCLLLVVLLLGAVGASVNYLGYTTGLLIAGSFGILLLWRYGNMWITWALFLIGGYFVSLKYARAIILIMTVYALHCVKLYLGWLGILLSVNLAFISNYLLNYLLQRCDDAREKIDGKEGKSEDFEEDLSEGHEYTSKSSGEAANCASCGSASVPSESKIYIPQKSASSVTVMKHTSNSLNEIKRILSSSDYYDVLGIAKCSNIDAAFLKKEYRRKAMLVHPDKNKGIHLASESFKKLQCAYEILLNAEKKREYDEQLGRQECRNVGQNPPENSQQSGSNYRSDESRYVHCTKCGNSHIWICTSRSKNKARRCQDCCQYHAAKDGDGWVEYDCSSAFAYLKEVRIPRAFVCAESKIFDASEWAICQGISCKPNTHRPSFRVNMVDFEKSGQRSRSSRFHWDLDAEMTEDDEQFEIWLQQALSSGLFSEACSRSRKGWASLKVYLHPKKCKIHW